MLISNVWLIMKQVKLKNEFHDRDCIFAILFKVEVCNFIHEFEEFLVLNGIGEKLLGKYW